MNPARSLGPALFAGGSALAVVWIYVVGPFLGALLAVGAYQLIRGGHEHTKNVLDEPPDEEKSWLNPPPSQINAKPAFSTTQTGYDNQ